LKIPIQCVCVCVFSNFKVSLIDPFGFSNESIPDLWFSENRCSRFHIPTGSFFQNKRTAKCLLFLAYLGCKPCNKATPLPP
jgi:hypothetical protein